MNGYLLELMEVITGLGSFHWLLIDTCQRVIQVIRGITS